jgi:hypothetical protein
MTSPAERRISSTRMPLACGCLLLLACVAQIAHAENYALLIGINTYPRAANEVKKLNYAEKDAGDLQATLIGRGFKPENIRVLPGNQARKTDILRELRSFARNPDIHPEDQFLVFFSGHGLLDAVTGKTFWLTHDTAIDTIEESGIRLEHLMDFVRDVKAGRKLVLLDHCHSGQIVNRERSPTAGGLTATAAAPAVTGRDSDLTPAVEKSPIPLTTIKDTLSQRASGLAVIAAAYDTAYETPGLSNGIFTRALIQALDSKAADSTGDGSLSLDELKLYVATKVPLMARDAGREQQVAEETGAFDTTRWIVVRSLPVSNIEAAKDERAGALLLLARWEYSQWITPVAKGECRDAYNAQIQSLETQTTMTDEKLINVLRNCRNYLKNATSADKQKALDLEEVLKAGRPEVSP